MIRRLFSDRILVKALPVNETLNKLILPEKSRIILYEKALIVAIGAGKTPDRIDYPMELKEGNVVLMKRGSGLPVKYFDLNNEPSWAGVMEIPDDEIAKAEMIDGDYRIIVRDDVIALF